MSKMYSLVSANNFHFDASLAVKIQKETLEYHIKHDISQSGMRHMRINANDVITAERKYRFATTQGRVTTMQTILLNIKEIAHSFASC